MKHGNDYPSGFSSLPSHHSGNSGKSHLPQSSYHQQNSEIPNGPSSDYGNGSNPHIDPVSYMNPMNMGGGGYPAGVPSNQANNSMPVSHSNALNLGGGLPQHFTSSSNFSAGNNVRAPSTGMGADPVNLLSQMVTMMPEVFASFSNNNAVSSHQPKPAIPSSAFNVPNDGTKSLYVDGVPIDAIEREVAHIFRPFPGFQNVRLIKKETRGGRKFYFCFVDFENSVNATIAKDTLQGYRFSKTDKKGLRISFAHNPEHKKGSK